MTTHTFAPTHYHRTLGWHEPVLHIADGDTVVTTSVDAAGRDASGEIVTQGGNPMTGPFFVDGAEPGDTLIMRLEHLRPSRDTGWSMNVLAPNVLDPESLAGLPEPDYVTWRLDPLTGTAAPDLPGTPLAGLRLPLAPMLGCFGVAPARGQAISTATSAQHGGNMDYRGCVAGVTMYFPVFAPGALIFVGDGHAVQGHGEIVGTGIETSFDIRFSVSVLKGQSIGWPRGEDERFICTLGTARPLDQALQHATTEMLAWLRAGYGLSLEMASTLMGQCVEYEVGNVYDPAYTMVCKMPKDVLRTVMRPG